MDEDRKGFLEILPASSATQQRLDHYANLLREWTEKINLVSSSTLASLWTRHFLDSGQLIKLIPLSTTTLADLGSGAGFPGLVLAILASDYHLSFHTILIEATGKKAEFLRRVAKELDLNVTVRNERIEMIRDLKPDVITARALKPLPDLLKLANYLTKAESLCLFLKGRNLPVELTQARKYWTFKLDTVPSRSDESGTLVSVRELHYKSRR